ncbi:uncharacterized protein LOC132736271 [Ruditapes philippinarum]|uniref:uncharacterized protein LOC132736271 n=1 Tax=Ruditapes philippinarum TaxID=129788 RepID=UPI00295C13A5|nr:uncharacterized protein LOC132736271 [Ruditapes philippinarum]
MSTKCSERKHCMHIICSDVLCLCIFVRRRTVYTFNKICLRRQYARLIKYWTQVWVTKLLRKFKYDIKFCTSIKKAHKVQHIAPHSNFNTDWFYVNTGLKQGCSLSPLLFNLYINDLALKLKATGSGVDIDGENIPILLYADDIVLVAESENDLQSMLNVLHNWRITNHMNVHPLKSSILHFRNPSLTCSDYVFKIGDTTLNYVTQYKYLSLVLAEHLDYSITAKTVAQAAHRALGMLSAKTRAFGGIPYEAYTKMYEATVDPVITYASSV